MFKVETIIADTIYKIYPLFYTNTITSSNSDDRILDNKCIICNKKDKETYITFISDENEEIVACGFCLPNISKAVQKSGGRLTLPTIFKILRASRKPEIVDLAIIGILPAYRKSGLSAIGIDMIQNILEEDGVQYCETNLNLENNLEIQSQWKHFNTVQHKRRRSFVKYL